MARRRFGLDLSAVTWALNSISGASDVVTLGRTVTGITVWNAITGGTQVTDLTNIGGSGITVVASDGNGVVGFYGPSTTPETVELYLDAGAGERQLVLASDLGPKVVDHETRLTTVEGQVAAIGVTETVNTVAASGATLVVPAPTTASMNFVTLTANCTATFPTATAGQSFTLYLKQDGTGSRTMAWPVSAKWPFAVAPTLSTGAAAIDRLTFVCPDGANWYGSLDAQAY
jgi:hypothetical protein